MKKLKVGKKTILFDDSVDGNGRQKHIFTDEQDNKLESVTDFTRILDKPALIPWAVKMAIDYLRNKWLEGEPVSEAEFQEAAKQHRLTKEKAADRGTAIHDLVSKWIRKQKYEIPEDEKIRNGFDAFLKFQQEHKAKWLENEMIVYSAKHNYVGILDALAVIDKKLTLVDFKSSNGIWPEMSYQVGGYRLAYQEMTKKKIEQSMIIRFSKDTGEFDFKIMSNPKQDEKAFLACVVLRRALNNK